MSGCHEPLKCECNCHTTNVKFIYASNPPKPCCQCNPLEVKYDDLLVKRVEALEKKIEATCSVTYTDRKPYKCPICEGQSGMLINYFCRACSSTGIIWG
jgi:hypothetical protein